MTKQWNLPFKGLLICVFYKDKLEQEIIEPYIRRFPKHKWFYFILVGKDITYLKAILSDDDNELKEFLDDSERTKRTDKTDGSEI